MFEWKSLVKYLLEGTAVAVAVYLIPSKKLSAEEILVIALTAAATFAVLDQFSPWISSGVRQGSGFAIGYQQVGMGNGNGNGNAPPTEPEPEPEPEPEVDAVSGVMDHDEDFKPFQPVITEQPDDQLPQKEEVPVRQRTAQLEGFTCGEIPMEF